MSNMYLPNRASHDNLKGDVPRPSSLLPLGQGNSDSPLPDHDGMEVRMALEQDWLSQVPRSSLESAAIFSYEQTIDGQIPTSDEYRGINVVHVNEEFPFMHTFPSHDPVSRPQNSLPGFPPSLNNSVIPTDSQRSFLLGSHDSPATALRCIAQLEPPLIPDLQGPINPFTSNQQTVVRPKRSDQIEPLIRLLFRLQRWSKLWPPAFKDPATGNSDIWTRPDIIGLFKASDVFIQILQGRDVRQKFLTKANLGTIFDIGVTAQSGSTQYLGPDRTWSSSLPISQLCPSLTPRDRMLVSLIRDCYDHLVYMFGVLIAPILQHCQQMPVHSDVPNGSGSSIRLYSSVKFSNFSAIQSIASIFGQIDRAMHEGAARLSPVEPCAQTGQIEHNTNRGLTSSYPRSGFGGKSPDQSSTMETRHSVAFQTMKTDQNNCLGDLENLDQRFRVNLASLCRLLRAA